MSESYGRSYVEWLESHKSPGASTYLDFVRPKYDDALLIASDDWGDTVLVLEPDGSLWYFTSDGNVIGFTEEVDGRNGGQHLHETLQSGIMSLWGR